MNLKDSALLLASKGFYVFPLASRSKKPESSTTTYKNATTNPEIIEAWWTLRPSSNIGLQPKASGIIILDIDNKNGGHLWLEKIEKENGPLQTLTVLTPSGGKHFYFKAPSFELSNKIGIVPGVDVIYSSNHVLVPPSIHPNGGTYEWVSLEQPTQECPPWFLKLLENRSPPPVNQNSLTQFINQKGTLSLRTMDFMSLGGTAQYKGKWNHELYQAAKNYQQNNFTYEEFLEAAKNITGHLDISDQKTIQSAFRTRPSFAPNIDTKDAIREAVLSSTLVTNVEDVQDKRFINLKEAKFYEFDYKCLNSILSKEAKRDYYENQTLLAVFDYHPHRQGLHTVDNRLISRINEYVPPPWKHHNHFYGTSFPVLAKLPSIYEEFFTHLVASHSNSLEYLLNWFTTSLRSRNYTILTAIGEEGIGKGVLGAILKGLHGEKNFIETSDAVFKGRFNARIKNKTLVYVDEISLETKESRDRIKATVNEYIEVEKKGVDAETVPNWASFYISSNHLDAIEVEPGDRRFSILQLTETKLRETPIISKIPELLKQENINELATYLVQREVTSNMLVPFRSEKFEQIRAARLKDWEDYFINEWLPSHQTETWPIKEVQRQLKEDCGLFESPGRPKFERLLKKYSDRFSIRRVDGKYRIIVYKEGVH